MLFRSLPGRVDEVGEAGGGFPRFVVLGEDERKDGRKIRGAGMVAQVVVPDADHVGEETQREERVLGVLMLEKHIEQGGVAIDLRAEKEIAGSGGEFGVDETAALKLERGPMDKRSQAAREMALEKRASGVWIGESGFDELVVGLVDRGIARRHRAGGYKEKETKNNPARVTILSGKPPAKLLPCRPANNANLRE